MAAGRGDDAKYTSDWGNAVILIQTNSPLLKKKKEQNALQAKTKCAICKTWGNFVLPLGVTII